MPAVLDLLQAQRIHPMTVSQSVLPFDEALAAFSEPMLKPIFVREGTRSAQGLFQPPREAATY